MWFSDVNVQSPFTNIVLLVKYLCNNASYTYSVNSVQWRHTHDACGTSRRTIRYPWKFRSDEVFFLNFQRPYGGEVGFLTLLCIFLHMSWVGQVVVFLKLISRAKFLLFFFYSTGFFLQKTSMPGYQMVCPNTDKSAEWTYRMLWQMMEANGHSQTSMRWY